MKERTKELPDRFVTVRLYTLKDKASMFRSKEPDNHIVEVMIGNVIVRELGHTRAKDATNTYNRLISSLSK